MTRDVVRPHPVVIGYLASAAAAIVFAAALVVNRAVVGDGGASPVGSAALSMTFGTLALALFLLPRVKHDLRNATRAGVGAMLLAGLAASWGGGFLFLALSKAPVVVVAPVGGVGPLVVILLSRLFLPGQELINKRLILGAILVVLGVALISIGRAT